MFRRLLDPCVIAAGLVCVSDEQVGGCELTVPRAWACVVGTDEYHCWCQRCQHLPWSRFTRNSWGSAWQYLLRIFPQTQRSSESVDYKNTFQGVEDLRRRRTSVWIQFYLDDCCCLILRDRRCFCLCFVVSAARCGKGPGVPTFLCVFLLLNHNCCCAATEITHTHTHTK